jgi:hypothetical protein
MQHRFLTVTTIKYQYAAYFLFIQHYRCVICTRGFWIEPRTVITFGLAVIAAYSAYTSLHFKGATALSEKHISVRIGARLFCAVFNKSDNVAEKTFLLAYGTYNAVANVLNDL